MHALKYPKAAHDAEREDKKSAKPKITGATIDSLQTVHCELTADHSNSFFRRRLPSDSPVEGPIILAIPSQKRIRSKAKIALPSGPTIPPDSQTGPEKLPPKRWPGSVRPLSGIP